MMHPDEFAKRLLELAKEKGCPAAETFSANHKAFSVDALNGEIDRYSVSRGAGVSLRVSLGEGKDGYAYTEAMEDPETLVDRAMDNARSIETADERPMQVAQTYRSVERPVSPLTAMTEQEKIALALRMEQAALAEDARVKRVSGCAIEESSGSISIRNTRGLAAERATGSAFCYVSVLAEEAGETQSGFAFRMGPEAADVEACAREAALDAVSRLGEKPVPTGAYPVIMKNVAMADLLTAFVDVFSADEAQKGRSLLAGKEGEAIAAPCVTLVDDPFHPASPRAFDGEGTPTRRKNILENGVLTTLLHNLKTARKAGVETTGNATRASAASAVGVGPSVLYLAPGAEGEDALIARMGTGLVINDLQGLHAGLNTVSGDFSLKAEGRRIEVGRDAGPVGQITVAGNFFTLLKSILAVGSDLAFTTPSGLYAASPSVLIASLEVAGE